MFIRVHPWLASLPLALALAGAGCASKEPALLPPDQRAKLLTIPDEYKRMKNPAPATAENELEGAARYGSFCASCHGADGKGNTPLGQALYPPAADLTSAEAKNYTDGQLFWIIFEGIRYSGMPQGRKLHTQDDVWKMILHVRTLQQARP